MTQRWRPDRKKAGGDTAALAWTTGSRGPVRCAGWERRVGPGRCLRVCGWLAACCLSGLTGLQRQQKRDGVWCGAAAASRPAVVQWRALPRTSPEYRTDDGLPRRSSALLFRLCRPVWQGFSEVTEGITAPPEHGPTDTSLFFRFPSPRNDADVDGESTRTPCSL